MVSRKRNPNRLPDFFDYEDEAREHGLYRPYLCSYYNPVSIDALRTIPARRVADYLQSMYECYNGQCNNSICLLESGWIKPKDVVTTFSQLHWLWLGDDGDIVTYVQSSMKPVLKEKKKIVEHHLKPEVVKRKVDKHVYLPDPEPVVHKTKVVRHLEPARTKKIVNKHVYPPEPVVQTECKIIYHQSSSRHQVSTTSHVTYHEHGESSKSAGKSSRMYLKAESEESGENDTRRHSSTRKGKGKRREDDDSESERSYVRKAKGKREEKRDRKRTSSRSRRRDHNDQDTESEHSRRSRSRSRSRSRRRSSHKRSTSTETQKRSSVRRSEKYHAHEPEAGTSEQTSDDDDDNGDVYYGSDTNNSESKVPPSSTKKAETSPNPPPAGSFDPYAALGLQDKRSTVDLVDIDAAYKFLVRKWHPDRHMNRPKEEQDKATERTAELNRAYDILGNSGRKKVYDRTGKTELWELDKLVEKEEKKEMAIARPGQGVAKGLKNFFEKK